MPPAGDTVLCRLRGRIGGDGTVIAWISNRSKLAPGERLRLRTGL